jgi:hypothetical protein
MLIFHESEESDACRLPDLTSQCVTVSTLEQQPAITQKISTVGTLSLSLSLSLSANRKLYAWHDCFNVLTSYLF